MVRTRVEVQEQTEVGDALVRGLVRAQLGLALRLGALVFGALAVIALLNSIFPTFSEATVLGFRPNWRRASPSLSAWSVVVPQLV